MQANPLSLEGKNVVVTGGSRGLGRGVVEALVARGAQVTVVARSEADLAVLRQERGVDVVVGDVADAALAETVVREVQPEVLVLNAGATPSMAPLHQQTWDSFSAIWSLDVKAAFHWLQAALRTPLPRGSRVLVTSSGAAIGGSPLSGGYAGAKRMLWLMSNYAHGVAAQLDLGISFQALVPQQIVGATDLGRAAATAYARRKGVSTEDFLAGFGAPLTPAIYGVQVAAVLTEPAYTNAAALGFKGDGVRILEERAA